MPSPDRVSTPLLFVDPVNRLCTVIVRSSTREGRVLPRSKKRLLLTASLITATPFSVIKLKNSVVLLPILLAALNFCPEAI